VVPRSPHARLVAALVAAMALASCGGSVDRPEPVATLAPARVEADIKAPANGAAVTAKKRVGSRLVARVAVAGRAERGTSLVVQSSCQDADCRRSFTPDTSGAFKELVTVWSQPGGRNGAIAVGPTRAPPADRDRVVVLLEPPAGAAAARRRATLPIRGVKPRASKSGQSEREAEPKRSQPSAQPAQAPESAPATPQAPVGAAPSGNASETLVMIGDSLAQGTEPFLGGLLPGWRVTTEARRGRPLAEGMQVLSSTPLGSTSLVLAFSLFTNDSPGNVGALEAAVRQSVRRAGSGGCAIWATIVRPPKGGVSYDAVNARLNALAGDPQLRGRLLIVPWAALTRSNPSFLGRDKVHATSAGFRERARLYAQAAESCAG
jgi:hypothetical protein